MHRALHSNVYIHTLGVSSAHSIAQGIAERIALSTALHHEAVLPSVKRNTAAVLVQVMLTTMTMGSKCFLAVARLTYFRLLCKAALL